MISDLISAAFPGWAQEKTRRHWGDLVSLLGLVMDDLVDRVNEARLAGLPGQVDIPGVQGLGGFDTWQALALLGRDLRRVRGIAETVPSYALGLRRSHDDSWRRGTPFGVLDELARTLSSAAQDPPLMRIVNGSGEWYTRDPDGTWRYTSAAGDGFVLTPAGVLTADPTIAVEFDWDSLTVPPPPDHGDGTRFWFFIYPPAASPYLVETDHTFADPGLVNDGWNDLTHATYLDSPDAGTVGTNAPHQLVEQVRAVIEDQRAAGFLCAWIVVCFDPDAFAPDGSSLTAYPDGRWGYCSRQDTGLNARVPSRAGVAEYWPAAPGGRAR